MRILLKFFISSFGKRDEDLRVGSLCTFQMPNQFSIAVSRLISDTEIKLFLTVETRYKMTHFSAEDSIFDR